VPEIFDVSAFELLRTTLPGCLAVGGRAEILTSHAPARGERRQLPSPLSEHNGAGPSRVESFVGQSNRHCALRSGGLLQTSSAARFLTPPKGSRGTRCGTKSWSAGRLRIRLAIAFATGRRSTARTKLPRRVSPRARRRHRGQPGDRVLHLVDSVERSRRGDCLLNEIYGNLWGSRLGESLRCPLDTFQIWGSRWGRV
jgi:hypothetical protein